MRQPLAPPAPPRRRRPMQFCTSVTRCSSLSNGTIGRNDRKTTGAFRTRTHELHRHYSLVLTLLSLTPVIIIPSAPDARRLTTARNTHRILQLFQTCCAPYSDHHHTHPRSSRRFLFFLGIFSGVAEGTKNVTHLLVRLGRTSFVTRLRRRQSSSCASRSDTLVLPSDS